MHYVIISVRVLTQVRPVIELAFVRKAQPVVAGFVA